MKINFGNIKANKNIELFLKLYKDKYIELKNILMKDKAFIKEVEILQLHVEDISQKVSKALLINLAFLYFLQNIKEFKKGFIRITFIDSIDNGKNFFKDFLIPIFYKAESIIGCKLLEINDDYPWEKVRFEIPNDFFSEVDKKSNGVLDLLDGYNFVLGENTLDNGGEKVPPGVLGRIFEIFQSGEDKKTKGVYYTPIEIVTLMCREALINYLYKETSIDYKIIKNFVYNLDLVYRYPIDYYKIDKALKTIKVADLAVGAGEFPIEMVNLIVNLRNTLGKNLLTHFPDNNSLYQLKYHTIANSIYAMDIDSRAVGITKLRLCLSLYQEQAFRSPINMNIYTGNSLIQDLGETKDDFNIVIGNPPYLGEKGNREVFREIAQTELGKRYYQGKMDLYYFFFHRAIDICKEGGIISFITTNYYLTANGGEKLRKDLKNRTRIIKFINFNEVKIFKTAMGQHNLISLLEKNSSSNKSEIEVVTISEGGNIQSYKTPYDRVFEGDSAYIRIIEGGDKNIKGILDKITQGIKIKELYNVNQGIVSGADTLTNSHIKRYGIDGERGEGIFVLRDEEIEEKNFDLYERAILCPFFKNSDIGKYNSINTCDKRIIYINRSLKNIHNHYPNIKRHLDKYYKILSRRREVEKGYIEYFHLHWGRREEIFNGEKIIAPQRSLSNTFAYNDVSWYSSADVYYITPKVEGIGLKYLLGVLNSRLYYIWFYYRGKRKGNMLELYQTPLKETPIIFSPNKEGEVICLVDEMLKEKDKNNRVLIQKKIDSIIYQIYNLTDKEIQYIERHNWN